MSSPRTGIAPIVICTDCGYEQPIAIDASGSPQACQNCTAELHFKREIACPHCRGSVPWSPSLGQCSLCGGAFAPGIPLKPKGSRSLSKVLSGALDVTQARKWDHLESDARRRSEELYRLWAALSRNEAPPVEESNLRSGVRPVAVQPGKRLTAWYGRWGVWAAVAAALVLTVWGGATAWRAATERAIGAQLDGLSRAASKADGRAMGDYYGASLVRFQEGYNVPHDKVARVVEQIFQDYPFVIRFDYTKPVFESISLGKVALLVDQNWELRGDEFYSGSERYRLIWKREQGEWRITSQELIQTHWSRKAATPPNASGGRTTAKGEGR